MLLKFITTILEKTYDLSRNIIYNPQKCVHGRKGFQCRNCVKNCNNQGISFIDNELQILENCNGCGKCIRNCKTGALQDPQLNLELGNNIINNEEIYIICCKSKNLMGIKVNCLLNIPHHILVELYHVTGGKLRFNKGICENCSKDNILIDDYINTLINNFNDTEILNIFKDKVDKGLNNDLTLSREEFLLYFTNKLKESSNKLILSSIYKDQTLVNHQHRVNLYLKRLKGTDHGIIGKEFTDNCTLCGKCGKLCPTDAIILEEKKGEKKIQYNYLKCIDCNRCIDNCSEKGILAGNKIKDFKIKKGKQCRTCGSVLEENNFSLLCNKCKSKRII
ncbi:4Fe-4S dicluster domain-containing protein [Anaerobranca californiensis DSM 14826]|jgi:ferredoxin|uniref:4Fe-4S dicluster domain-containing protein n=1 Tax=Anaerobranca californiensis DSM 14826 TaxID=1120989 RepID=A0A1M6QV85_9FIRM|nr:4Fe-4S dicluster domain-containing protein [Anaerobranca californiensis]SHK23977.1 4Fe-4S dicluster domain-containing protein [Anaerobranca californiensis DSM 14826]